MHLCYFIIKGDNTDKGVRLVKTGAKYTHTLIQNVYIRVTVFYEFYGKDIYAEK